MPTLTQDDHLWIERSVLCWLATVGPIEGADGDDDAAMQPSVSPKELWVVDGDAITIANVASPNSARNVKRHARVCVAFLDVFRQKGVQVYGTAELITKKDARFDALAAPLTRLGGPDFPFASVFAVTPDRTRPIVAPRYKLFPETTEAEQIADSRRSYRINRPM